MMLELAEALPSLVGKKFRAARAAKQLIFSPTELTVINTSSGLPFQLRYCPSLAKKPTPSSEHGERPAKKVDPFENPSQDLLVAEIPASSPSHILVLNKFPVIEDHFIIATKTHKEQTHRLERDDVALTFECLKAWESDNGHTKNRRLFAFFNSGPHSGASQPHRHLQFLPVESMISQGRGNGSWKTLIDLLAGSALSQDPNKFLTHPSLPMVHFVRKFPIEPSQDQLYDTYTALYEAALLSVHNFIDRGQGDLQLHPVDTGSLPISYNLAMTTDAMAICPRQSEGIKLRNDDSRDEGFVAVNGTVLSGSLMVKGKLEWDLLREKPGALDQVLESVGIPLRYTADHPDSNKE